MILYLPGRKSRDEMDFNVTFLRSKGLEVIDFNYKNWETGEDFKLDLEVDRVKLLPDLDKISIIIAKSIGTLITTRLFTNKVFKLDNFTKIVFFGIPLLDLSNSEQQEIKEFIKSDTLKFELIHNKDDDHGSISALRELLNFPNLSLIEKDSNNHQYRYPQDIFELVSK